MKEEEKATGIAPDEPTNLDKAVEEIAAKFEQIELELSLNKEKTEKENETATEMKQRCIETYADTKKRKPDESGNSDTTRREREIQGVIL